MEYQILDFLLSISHKIVNVHTKYTFLALQECTNIRIAL